MSDSQRILKRSFDVILSILLISLLVLPILFLIVLATLDTKQWGVFTQSRVGQFGNLFKIYKLRTLKSEPHRFGRLEESATALGRYLRQTKLDELPQLFNILVGQMSFVGPRPDVAGYADLLTGADRVLLEVKPGLTGPASITYRNEEAMLRSQPNPKQYYDTVIWPDKVKINIKYIETWRFSLDLNFIFKSIYDF